MGVAFKETKMQRFFKAKFFLLTFIFYITTNQIVCADKKEASMNKCKKEDFEIPLTEDLMREHGILNRVLLIYEEIIRRIESATHFPASVLSDAVGIIKSFIEDYHEMLEENYIFPLFEKNKKEVRLVRTLKNQHNKGREITAKLKTIVTTKKSFDSKDKKVIKSLLQKFITMYRPHEAREDTVLFPQVRSLISEKEFEDLGEKFEDLEHKLFGQNGFEHMVDKVATIEKKLGIYQLEQFTPVINK